MRYRWMWATLGIVQLLFPGCGRRSDSIDPTEYRRQIDHWRQGRLTRLTSETGWLTLCGLFWLAEGSNRCGSDTSNAVILPRGKAPGFIGTFGRRGNSVQFVADPHVEVRNADTVVRSLSLTSDAEEGGPTILTFGTLSFYVISRGERFAVRVKDRENQARMNFKGLEYFPVDLNWRITAKFERYTPSRILHVPDATGGTQEFTCPGALAFELGGKSFSLDAVLESATDKEFFIMFSDQSSGIDTYGGGRQLYVDPPDSLGTVILDFNKAYNWPCVFTEFATCPIPPPQNRLPIRVAAGEKMYAASEGPLHKK